MKQNRSIAGEWAGLIRMPGGKVALEIHLRRKQNDGWTGTFSIPSTGVDSAPLRNITVAGDSVSFRLIMSESEGPLFRGTLKEGGKVIRGSVLRGGVKIPITLVRPGSEAAQRLSEVATREPKGLSEEPFGARFITADIRHFWEAFDRAAPEFKAETFKKFYLEQGTPGLKAFWLRRIESAEKLAKQIREHTQFYVSIRESTLRIKDMAPAIRASFFALEYLYPEAIYPDVYFLIGRMTTGGTTSLSSLLIGAEMYGLTSKTPIKKLSEWHQQVLSSVEEIPHVVAHELVHFQQKYPETNTLLAQSIVEGAADFIGELISGQGLNEHLREYANPRKKALWQEFKQEMYGEDYTGWLYGGTDAKNRPADLGYWMGYQIVEAYYEQAENKREAIEAILEIDNFKAFLRKSGYPDDFTNLKPLFIF